MHMLFRLLGPRRRKNQEEIAGRAAEVINHVLFDVGIDRFLNGTMLLDRQFRLHFYAVPPRMAGTALASVPVREVHEARTFGAQLAGAGIGVRFDQAMLARHVGVVVDGLMRELRARSPDLRALPASRETSAASAVAG